MNKMKNK